MIGNCPFSYFDWEFEKSSNSSTKGKRAFPAHEKRRLQSLQRYGRMNKQPDFGSCEGRERMAAITTLGLGKTMEKKLHSVGIHSAEELKAIGSRQAVSLLKERYPNTCVVILYHLEAAVRGTEIKHLDASCKAELKAYFQQLST